MPRRTTPPRLMRPHPTGQAPPYTRTAWRRTPPQAPRCPTTCPPRLTRRVPPGPHLLPDRLLGPSPRTPAAGWLPQAPTAALHPAKPVRAAPRLPGLCSPRPPARLCRGAGGPVPTVPLARPRGTRRTVPALTAGDSLPRGGEPSRPGSASSRVGWGPPSCGKALPGGGAPPGRGRCFLVFPPAPLVPNAAAQPRLEAGAQRTLEGVGCSRLFGAGWAPHPALEHALGPLTRRPARAAAPVAPYATAGPPDGPRNPWSCPPSGTRSASPPPPGTRHAARDAGGMGYPTPGTGQTTRGARGSACAQDRRERGKRPTPTPGYGLLHRALAPPPPAGASGRVPPGPLRRLPVGGAARGSRDPLPVGDALPQASRAVDWGPTGGGRAPPPRGSHAAPWPPDVRGEWHARQGHTPPANGCPRCPRAAVWRWGTRRRLWLLHALGRRASRLRPRVLWVFVPRAQPRTPGVRRGEQRERGTSGRCLPSPAPPCWAGLGTDAHPETRPVFLLLPPSAWWPDGGCPAPPATS